MKLAEQIIQEKGNQSTDKLLSKWWKSESASAQRRTTLHWEKVSSKRKKMPSIKEEMASIEEEMASIEEEMASIEEKLRKLSIETCETIYTYSWERNQKRDRLKGERNRLKEDLESKGREYEDVRTAPPPVIQPLPKDEFRGKCALLFIHLPTVAPLLHYLSQTGFIAQKCLSPENLVPSGKSWLFSWKSHYNQNSYKSLHNNNTFLPWTDQSLTSPIRRKLSMIWLKTAVTTITLESTTRIWQI